LLLIRGPDFLGLESSNFFITILIVFAIPGIVLLVFREKKEKKISKRKKNKETVSEKIESFIPFQWAMPFIIMIIMISLIISLTGG